MNTLKMKEAEIKNFLARRMGDKLAEIALFVVELALVVWLVTNVVVPVLHMFVAVTFPIMKLIIAALLLVVLVTKVNKLVHN